MADKMGKPTAQSYAAGINKEVGASPLHWSDKCFLCNSGIGETDPRSFYTGKSAMMLCHQGCLNLMNAHGGSPEDYHRAMSPNVGTADQETADVGRSGPSWLEFPTLAEMVSYVRERGEIPPHVRVTVAGKVIQG